MFPTTIVGSLPKPHWLAEPNRLWAPWRHEGAALETAQRDATILALKLQEDCGIDIVTDGELSRQHFVHGFLAMASRRISIGRRRSAQNGDSTRRSSRRCGKAASTRSRSNAAIRACRCTCSSCSTAKTSWLAP